MVACLTCSTPWTDTNADNKYSTTQFTSVRGSHLIALKERGNESLFIQREIQQRTLPNYFNLLVTHIQLAKSFTLTVGRSVLVAPLDLSTVLSNFLQHVLKPFYFEIKRLSTLDTFKLNSPNGLAFLIFILSHASTNTSNG